MSSPVTVNVSIVDLNLFAQAAKDEGYEMKEVMQGDVLAGLTYGAGYQTVTVDYDEKAQSFKLHADSHHVDAFKNKVIPRYSALQLRQKLEETGRFTFGQDWMTRNADHSVEVNAMFRR